MELAPVTLCGGSSWSTIWGCGSFPLFPTGIWIHKGKDHILPTYTFSVNSTMPGIKKASGWNFLISILSSYHQKRAMYVSCLMTL